MTADRIDTSARGDLASRDDIVRLVDGFYGRVRVDSTLGPIFDGVARVDWGAHLPKMYDFWESVLFGTAFFKGNPLAVHRALARKTPMTNAEFGRWVSPLSLARVIGFLISEDAESITGALIPVTGRV